jgi:hypothetical protein
MNKITIALKLLPLISLVLLPLTTNAQMTPHTLESGLRFVSKDTTFSYRILYCKTNLSSLIQRPIHLNFWLKIEGLDFMLLAL